MKKIIEFFKIMIITFSFFTAIPMPTIKWKEARMKVVPLFLPLVGLVIGLLTYYFGIFLIDNEFSSITISLFLTATYILLTGGLHIDALMDTCDSHFSRRDRKRKLEIMKDSNVGAFAVCFFIVLLLIKIGIIHEIIEREYYSTIIIFIPIISRLLQVLMLLNSKFATNEGLAVMYGKSLTFSIKFFNIIQILIITAIIYYFDYNSLIILLVALLYFVYYKNFCYKQYDGITGDLIGAYLEVVEVIMLLSLLMIGIVL